MTNHVHLIAIPGREDSLAVLLRRVHGRYAQYYNTRCGRSRHLWQNRFFACVLSSMTTVGGAVLPGAQSGSGGHRVASRRLPLVERSSARAHLACADASGILDMDWWRREHPENRAGIIDNDEPEAASSLRRCTYPGRPFGGKAFVDKMSRRFGRYWARGRPQKERTIASRADQFSLFAD